MSLYHISNDYLKTLNELDNSEEESDQLSLLDKLDILLPEAKEKILMVAAHIRNIQEEEDSIRRAVKDMEERARRLKLSTDRWKKYILDHSEKMHIQFPLKCDFYQVNMRKNPPKLEILDHEKLMFDYSIVKEEIILNKEAIKEGLLSGKQIEGAKLTYNKSIIIK